MLSTILSGEVIEVLIKMADTDGDGKLNLNEFLKVNAQALSMDEQAQTMSIDELKTQFQELDLDNSGFVTRDELKKALLKKRKDVPEEVVDEIIKMADKDGDGKIDIGELLKYIK